MVRARILRVGTIGRGGSWKTMIICSGYGAALRCGTDVNARQAVTHWQTEVDGRGWGQSCS